MRRPAQAQRKNTPLTPEQKKSVLKQMYKKSKSPENKKDILIQLYNDVKANNSFGYPPILVDMIKNLLSDDNIADASVNEILKKHARVAGIEDAINFSSHSLRRGLATTASRDGVSLPAIMRQGRWKQVGTVMEYIEAAQRFEENAAGLVLQKLPNKESVE